MVIILGQHLFGNVSQASFGASNLRKPFSETPNYAHVPEASIRELLSVVFHTPVEHLYPLYDPTYDNGATRPNQTLTTENRCINKNAGGPRCFPRSEPRGSVTNTHSTTRLSYASTQLSSESDTKTSDETRGRRKNKNSDGRTRSRNTPSTRESLSPYTPTSVSTEHSNIPQSIPTTSVTTPLPSTTSQIGTSSPSSSTSVVLSSTTSQIGSSSPSSSTSVVLSSTTSQIGTSSPSSSTSVVLSSTTSQIGTSSPSSSTSVVLSSTTSQIGTSSPSSSTSVAISSTKSIATTQVPLTTSQEAIQVSDKLSLTGHKPPRNKNINGPKKSDRSNQATSSYAQRNPQIIASDSDKIPTSISSCTAVLTSGIHQGGSGISVEGAEPRYHQMNKEGGQILPVSGALNENVSNKKVAYDSLATNKQETRITPNMETLGSPFYNRNDEITKIIDLNIGCASGGYDDYQVKEKEHTVKKSDGTNKTKDNEEKSNRISDDNTERNRRRPQREERDTAQQRPGLDFVYDNPSYRK